MHWQDIPTAVCDWAEKAAAPGYDLRQAASSLPTCSPVGYYFDPETARVGVFAPMVEAGDAARVKRAALRAAGTEPLFLSYQDLADPDGTWVKVAYSPALRRGGELLNFFPGQYPGGIPNAPSPVAAMLTSGLLGAGLGWGTGKLLGKILPDKYGDNLSRAGLVAGGLLGAAPGAMWGGANKLTGKNFNDPSLLSGPAGVPPVEAPVGMDGIGGIDSGRLDGGGAGTSEAIEALKRNLENAPARKLKFGWDGCLGEMYKQAAEKVADLFGRVPQPHEHSPTDVNINALGQTLWDTGASPGLAATTMAGMYAAQQMPDPNSRPGWVTGHQLGQLAQNAAGDYVRGYLVGSAINTVIGTPIRNSQFGAGNAVLGVIGAVVPKLFGG